MQYRVKTTLSLRQRPDERSTRLRLLPMAALVTTDRTVASESGTVFEGPDDPTTPEPARHSSAWVHITRILTPDGHDIPVDGYSALAYLTPVTVAPLDPATLTAKAAPRISLALFAHVLQLAGSPAARDAAACYGLIQSRGIDPAIGLAFFMHESTYGLRGVAARALNWGNLRHSPRGRGVVRQLDHGPYVFYSSWRDSAADWADLIAGPLYVAGGLATILLITHRYAPASDGNDPDRYARIVASQVELWQAQDAPASTAV